MRQRKPKNLAEKLQNCSEYLISEPAPGIYTRCFGNDNPTFLEIGCGKGNFIIKKAQENPENNYIAIEGQDTVILRALEKAKEIPGGIPNLRFMNTFVQNMADLFDESQISGIYLNFSDPW